MIKSTNYFTQLKKRTVGYVGDRGRRRIMADCQRMARVDLAETHRLNSDAGIPASGVKTTTTTLGAIRMTLEPRLSSNKSLTQIDTSAEMLEVIAQGLGNECRFAGQLPGNKWYSVAEHCIRLYQWGHFLNLELSSLRQIMLHDAAEALGFRDVPTYIKDTCPAYKAQEHKLMGQIFKFFSLPEDMRGLIKDMDKQLTTQEYYEFYHGQRMTIPGVMSPKYWERHKATTKWLRLARTLLS